MGSIDKVRVLQDARWSCGGCGFCCHFHELGPVEPEIVAHLEAQDVGALTPAAAEGNWYTLKPGPDGTSTVWLAKKNGACVFLTESNHCAVHAKLGAESKPGFCRAFPFVAVRDPKGIAFVNRSDCESAPVTATTGVALTDQVRDAFAIPHSRMTRTFSPTSVQVQQGFGVAISEWMGLESQLLGDIHGVDGPPEALVCTVRQGLSEQLSFAVPKPDPNRYRMASFAVLEALRMVMDHAIATESAPSSADAAFALEMRTLLMRAQSGLAEPLAVLAADGRAYLNLVLRSMVLGKGFVGPGSVGAAMGLYLLNAIVARTGFTGESAMTASDLAVVHPRWSRLTHNRTLHAILQKARPALEDMWLHVS